MANDLELKIRIKAELDQVRKSLSALNDDLSSLGDGSNSAATGLADVQRELDSASGAASAAGKGLNTVQQELEQTGNSAAAAATGLADAKREIEQAANTAQAAGRRQRTLKTETDAAADAAKRQASEVAKAAQAQERERQSAQELAANLRQQAQAYGLTGSRLLELNKQRDLSKIKTDAERRAVSAAYDEIITKARQAEREQAQASSGIATAMNNAKAAVAGFLTVYSAVAAIRGISSVTDEYARYTSQLKLTTNSAQELATAQADVFRIAQATRAPVQDVAQTYAMLQRSTERLGKSQEEIVNVLETVNKAVALTPVSAEVASSTLVQFGQALSGDFKNGAQEINSILEQTPGLAIAIADGLGVATSELKQLGEDGKLSAEIVFNALASVGSQIDSQFQKIPATVGGALTQLRNDVVNTFGSMDVSPLTDSINDFREAITDPAVAQGLANMAGALVRVAGAAASAISELANLTSFIGEELASEINGPALDDLTRVSERIDELQAALRPLERGDAVVQWLNADRIKEYRAELDKLQGAYKATFDAQEAAAKAQADEDKRRKQLEEQAKAQAALLNVMNELEAKEKEGKKQLEQRQKAIAQTIASLKEQAETYGKSTEETVRYQLAIQGASEAEQERGAALGRQLDALKAQEEAEKKAAQASEEAKRKAIQAAKERADAEKKLADELEQVRIRILQASGQTVEARGAQLVGQYDDIIAQLKAKGDQAGVDLVNKLINLEVASARLDKLKADISKVLNDLRDAEQSADARVSTGEISSAEGAQAIQLARAEATPQLQAFSLELAALETEGVPGAVDALDDLEERLRTLSEQSASGTALAIRSLRAELNQTERTLVSSATNSAVDSLTNSFLSMADGSKSAGEAVKDFVRSFAASMAQMAARALAMYAILQILNAIPGGAAVASAMDIGARVRHTGGRAGHGPMRRVPAFVFAGAPRYHDGGVAGLKPGEVPAILQTGEEVLARNDPRNSVNGGGGGQSSGSGVRILNVVDPSLVQDYLASSAGEETIINTIQRNAGSIKQVLT